MCQQSVFVDLVRPVGSAVSAHIGRHRVVSGFGKRTQLMTPRIPGLGKSVAEDDERPAACFGQADANAVRLDRPMRDFDHAVLRRRRRMPS